MLSNEWLEKAQSLTPHPPPTMTSLGFSLSFLNSSSSSSARRAFTTGKCFGPPRSGCSARGDTGTRSTCLSVYVNASCMNMAVPRANTPAVADSTRYEVYFATRKERRRKRDLGRGSRGTTGLVRSGDDPAANERVRHGAGRGTSDMWTGVERLVRPWAALRGRKTCENLSMLVGNDGGCRAAECGVLLCVLVQQVGL